MKENPVQQRIRLEAGAQNVIAQRNNVGACYDDTGRLIRYGLMNDTAEMNRTIKSSDLICITPVLITAGWIGHVVGVYTAVECKSDDWVFRPSDTRAVAQVKYHDLVRQYGGFAGFARSAEEFKRIIRR